LTHTPGKEDIFVEGEGSENTGEALKLCSYARSEGLLETKEPPG